MVRKPRSATKPGSKVIRADLAASPFTGKDTAKSTPACVSCRDSGSAATASTGSCANIGCSRSAERVRSTPAKAHAVHIITSAPNLRWATDGAEIWTSDESWVWLFTTVEHWNGECLGHHVAKVGNRFAAYEPRRRKP